MIENLDDIHTGDRVAMNDRDGYFTILTVTGETPKQLIVNGVKYWKKDGSRVGPSNDRWYYLPSLIRIDENVMRSYTEQQRYLKLKKLVSAVLCNATAPSNIIAKISKGDYDYATEQLENFLEKVNNNFHEDKTYTFCGRQYGRIQ